VQSFRRREVVRKIHCPVTQIGEIVKNSVQDVILAFKVVVDQPFRYPGFFGNGADAGIGKAFCRKKFKGSIPYLLSCLLPDFFVLIGPYGGDC